MHLAPSMGMRRGDAVGAAAVGLLGALVSLAWVGRPSFWYDEAATIASTDRSLADLARLVEKRDAVHALYYAAMHGWRDLVGTSEVALRLPSVLATGVTCVLVYVLGHRLAGARTALAAGLVAAVLPGLSWAGTEGRPYALATSLATLASLILVVAVQGERRRYWVLYAVTVAVSAYLFLFAALLLACHLVTVAALRSGRRAWLLAAAAVTAGVAPLAVAAVGQRGQISWIKAGPSRMAERALVNQYFLGLRPEDEQDFLTVCGVLLAVASLLLVLVAVVTGVRSAADGVGPRLLVALALPWAVVPAVLLIAASALVMPVYVERYAVFGAPAVALLVGQGVARLWDARGTWFAAVILATLVLLTGPALVAQKAPDAKGEDYRAAADFTGGGEEGEAELVLYDNADALGVPRAYPEPFQDLAQPNRVEDRPDQGLFGTVRGPDDLEKAVVRGRTVVLFRVRRQPDLGLARWLSRQGCSASPETYEDARLKVTRYAC